MPCGESKLARERAKTANVESDSSKIKSTILYLKEVGEGPIFQEKACGSNRKVSSSAMNNITQNPSQDLFSESGNKSV